TLTEQQLHDALFLPALQTARPRDEPAPASVLQPGRLEACAGAGANCAVSKAASALLYCGVVRTCAEGACYQGGSADVAPDDVATSLYYYQALAQATAPSTVAPAACGPVPMSVHLSTLVSEAVTATNSARFIEAQPWNAATLGAPGSPETAADLRVFFDRHPRGICLFMRGIDVERPREAGMAAQTLAFPVFAPFDPRLPSRATPLLRSLQRAAFDEETMAALFGRCEPGGEKACKLKRESMAEKRLQCLQQPGICLFRALWNLDAPARPEPGEDGFESLVALFARRDGSTRCVRRLFNALATASEDRLLELQRDLREPVAAGENRAPCDARARALAGLVPRNDDGLAPACEDPGPAQPDRKSTRLN